MRFSDMPHMFCMIRFLAMLAVLRYDVLARKFLKLSAANPAAILSPGGEGCEGPTPESEQACEYNKSMAHA